MDFRYDLSPFSLRAYFHKLPGGRGPGCKNPQQDIWFVNCVYGFKKGSEWVVNWKINKKEWEIQRLTPNIFPNAKFTSSIDRYYTTLLYRFEAPLTVSLLTTAEESAISFVQGEQKFKLHGYIGPKEYEILNSIEPELTDAIEYGWFTFDSKTTLQIYYTGWRDDIDNPAGWSIDNIDNINQTFD